MSASRSCAVRYSAERAARGVMPYSVIPRRLARKPDPEVPDGKIVYSGGKLACWREIGRLRAMEKVLEESPTGVVNREEDRQPMDAPMEAVKKEALSNDRDFFKKIAAEISSETHRLMQESPTRLAQSIAHYQAVERVAALLDPPVSANELILWYAQMLLSFKKEKPEPKSKRVARRVAAAAPTPPAPAQTAWQDEQVWQDEQGPSGSGRVKRREDLIENLKSVKRGRGRSIIVENMAEARRWQIALSRAASVLGWRVGNQSLYSSELIEQSDGRVKFKVNRL